MGYVPSVPVGARYSTRDYDYSRQVFQYGPGSGYVHDLDLPISEQTGDVVCWQDEYSHFPCFISFDAEAILAQAVSKNLVLICDPQTVFDCDESELDANGPPLPRRSETIAHCGHSFSHLIVSHARSQFQTAGLTKRASASAEPPAY